MLKKLEEGKRKMIEKYMIGASWCSKCQALKKTAEDLGFIYIDTDEDCTNAVERYNIKALPTFIVADERMKSCYSFVMVVLCSLESSVVH